MIGEEGGKVKIIDLKSSKVIATFHCQEEPLLVHQINFIQLSRQLIGIP
jgi:hypothetical protein